MAFPLNIGLLAALVTASFSQIANFEFVRWPSYTGIICTAPTMTTIEMTSVTKCAGHCGNVYVKGSFFYNTEIRACSCISGVMVSNTTCVTSTSTVYYAPIDGYHSSCTSDNDCQVSNTGCWHGVCECSPGYMYATLEGRCVDDCSTSGLGSTYTNGYIGKDLTCSDIKYLRGVSPDFCFAGCSQTAGCLSVSYHHRLSACKYRPCRYSPVDNPFVDNAMVTIYTRNCGPTP